mmetsp:Transcript_54291/g.142974  ORF Transcript_54291/g.142974 Transcript_54291/m.142974 type:complete len:273 (+) Transcript_54291:217-1035(+)
MCLKDFATTSLCALKPVPACTIFRMSSFPFSLMPVTGQSISLRTQSAITLSRTTTPDGLMTTACWCVIGRFETAQQYMPLSPPLSIIFWSVTSNFTGTRSLARSLFPDMGHLAAVSTFLNGAGSAFCVVQAAQKLFSAILPLSITSSSPLCSFFSGLLSSSSPPWKTRLVCRASPWLRMPRSKLWKSSSSFCASAFTPAAVFASLRLSCSSYFLASAWSSTFCRRSDSRMHSLSKRKPSGVTTGSFGGFSERQQWPKGRKQSVPRTSLRTPA